MSSFNPKPEAMAADVCGPSILLPAIASGFGLNDACGHFEPAAANGGGRQHQPGKIDDLRRTRNRPSLPRPIERLAELPQQVIQQKRLGQHVRRPQSHHTLDILTAHEIQ